jgi:hypothetical protein
MKALARNGSSIAEGQTGGRSSLLVVEGSEVTGKRCLRLIIVEQDGNSFLLDTGTRRNNIAINAMWCS